MRSRQARRRGPYSSGQRNLAERKHAEAPEVAPDPKRPGRLPIKNLATQLIGNLGDDERRIAHATSVTRRPGIVVAVTCGLCLPLRIDLSRSQGLRGGGSDCRSAGDHRRAKGPAGLQPEGLHRLCEGQPGQDEFQFGGAGSSAHLACALFNAAIGVNITHVPYRGGGPALQEIIAGRNDYLCATVGSTAPQIASGDIKAIALLTKQRVPSLPQVPTAHARRGRGFHRRFLDWIVPARGQPVAIGCRSTPRR